MANPDAWSALAAVAMLLAGAAGSVQASAQTVAAKPAVSVDQIIAANIASRGGLARLERVRTQRLRGTITFADGTVHTLSSDLARPVRIRTEITFDAGRLIQAYDGRVAWTVNPFGAHPDLTPRVLPTGEALNVAAGGDMDGPLVNYKRKGNGVTLAGLDTADGRPAYRLDVVTASGLHDSYFMDTASHLQTKWLGHRVVNGEPVVFESYFRDYRRVDGVMIAFQIDSDTEGKIGTQRIRLATVGLNSSLPDSEFEFPARRRPHGEGVVPARHRSYPVELLREASFVAPSVRAADSPAMPTRGFVTEDSLYSPALGVTKKFLVYLPQSYRSDSSRRYAVAYYLHGTGGNERSWVVGLAIDSVLDSLITTGMPEMIVVMPDGDDGYYHTWKTSRDYPTCLRWRAVLLSQELPTDYCVPQMRYGDYIAHDLVARVDSVYRTVPDASHRGVGGFSMGGFGAVYLPLKYRGVFGAGASLSGAGLALLRIGGYPSDAPVREATTIAELRTAWGRSFAGMAQEVGPDIEDWRADDPVSMARRAVADGQPTPALWLIVGTEDASALVVNRMFHQALDTLGVPHTYVEAAGGHTIAFWRAHEAESLVWMARAIARLPEA